MARFILGTSFFVLVSHHNQIGVSFLVLIGHHDQHVFNILDLLSIHILEAMKLRSKAM